MATARSVILAVVNDTQLMQMQDFFSIKMIFNSWERVIVKAGGAAATGRYESSRQ